MEKNCKMKSGFVIVAILIASFVSANAALAYDPNVFPGKGSREAWNRSGLVFNEGNDLGRAGKYDASIKKIEEAIKIYPYCDGYFVSLGVSYKKRRQSGDLIKAEAAFRKAVELEPKDWRNWKALTNGLLAAEKFKEAREAGAKALECNPPAQEAAVMRSSLAEIDKYMLTHK
ncbi:MAG: hypothetical protein K2W95_12210 [Candidatus Obscuribacterales bacterium]|nr:hypothetical protein [Candidatus Obscuribacterales bacterium]